MLLLYALSTNEDFLKLASGVLNELRIKVIFFQDTESLSKAIEERQPLLVLYDYEEGLREEIAKMLTIMESRFTNFIISSVLVHASSSELKKMNFISSGIDYFLPKPINLLELLAYLSSSQRLRMKVSRLLTYGQHASTVDTMSKLSDYLNSHVKEPIQRFIDHKPQYDLKDDKVNEYLRESKKSAIEVLAAMHAVKEELQVLIQKSKEDYKLEDLDDLFEKNLMLTHIAYGIDIEEKQE